MGTLAPSSDATWEIINSWNRFNKRDSFATHMRELYPVSSKYLWHLLVRNIPFPTANGGSGSRLGAQGHGGGNQGFSGKGEYEMII